MPLTRPYLDMVNIDSASSVDEKGKTITAKANKVIWTSDGKYSLQDQTPSAQVATIVDAAFDYQKGVLSLIFSNGSVLKATGFPNISRIGKGIQGPQGKPGKAGEPGRNGRDGDKGATGCVGENGPEGNRGEKGAQGDRGEQGERGDQGKTGDIGPIGPRGDRGEIGPRGPKGDKGRDGVDGYVNVVISDTDPGDSIGPLGIWIKP